MTTKRGRGAPSKEQALKNKEERLKKDLVEKIIKGKALAVENYDKYIEALNQYALGEIKDASVTNRISCIKYMLEYCEKVMEEEVKKSSKEDEDTTPKQDGEKPVQQQSSVLVDFNYKKKG